HVERDDIGLDVANPVQAVLPVDGGEDLKALEGQVDGDQLPDDLIVIDNQHPPESLCHGREATGQDLRHACRLSTCPAEPCDWYPCTGPASVRSAGPPMRKPP